MKSFDKAINLNPSTGEAYYGKGEVYLKTKDYKMAIINYTKSI